MTTIRTQLLGTDVNVAHQTGASETGCIPAEGWYWWQHDDGLRNGPVNGPFESFDAAVLAAETQLSTIGPLAPNPRNSADIWPPIADLPLQDIETVGDLIDSLERCPRDYRLPLDSLGDGIEYVYRVWQDDDGEVPTVYLQYDYPGDSTE